MQDQDPNPEDLPSPHPKGARDARRLAERLFKSSGKAEVRQRGHRPAMPQRTSIQTAEFTERLRRASLLHLRRLAEQSRAFEVQDCTPKEQGSAQPNSGVTFLVMGKGGRSLHLALATVNRERWRSPPYWSRLEGMGHGAQFLRVTSADQARELMNKTLKNRGIWR